MTLRRSGGLQFFVRQQTPLLLDSYPSPCYTTRPFEPNFKKHAVVFCKPLLLGISPKNLVLMKVKHLLFLGKLLGLRPRSEWVNTTRVPWPLGGHMKDCFIDSVKFKRLMKVRCTCTTATLLWYKTVEWESKTYMPTLPYYPGVSRIRHQSPCLPYGSPYLPDKIIFRAFLCLSLRFSPFLAQNLNFSYT